MIQSRMSDLSKQELYGEPNRLSGPGVSTRLGVVNGDTWAFAHPCEAVSHLRVRLVCLTSCAEAPGRARFGP